MGIVWNPWALPNLVAAGLIVLIAFFILHIGSGRTTNRLLAAVLLLHGFGWGSLGLQYSQTEPSGVVATQVLVNSTLVLGLALYPAFLGHALVRAPRFLRSRPWLLGSIAFGASVAALNIVRPSWSNDGVVDVPFAAYDTVPGPLTIGMLLLAILVSLFGLGLSIYEIIGTRLGTQQRERARSFLMAFGIQDLLLLFGAVLVAIGSPEAWFTIAANVAIGAIGSLAASVLVSYGIIRHQLFDIEVQLRFAVSRSTMAAAFVAVFFVGQEAAQQFFGRTSGSAYVGILASGLLVFAIAPLQRAAERLAEKAFPSNRAAVPGADGEDAEEAFRRALHLALRDARLSREEEGDLFRLARALRIDAARAHELLADVERERETTR